jgi:hypothetical protein
VSKLTDVPALEALEAKLEAEASALERAELAEPPREEALEEATEASLESWKQSQ